MAFPDQPAGGLIRAGIVVEIEPRVRLRELAAAERQERNPAACSCSRRGSRSSVCATISASTRRLLHHAHIAVFVRQIVVSDEQQVNLMSRQFVANFADHVHKNAVIERNRMHRKHQPDGVDFAHPFRRRAKGIWSVATALGLRFHAGARLSRNVVIPVEGAADGGNRQPQFLGNGFKLHDFPCIFVSFVPPPAARAYLAPAP